MTEVERLTKELERAYRTVCGFNSFARDGVVPDSAMLAYHSLTIGAARRFVFEGSLDGADYFVGKPVEVLQTALTQSAE